MSPTEQAYRLVAERITFDVDAEVRKGLERVLGRPIPEGRYNLLDLFEGRTLQVDFSTEHGDTYYCDGEAFLHVGPVQTEHDRGVVTATRKVRHYEAAR